MNQVLLQNIDPITFAKLPTLAQIHNRSWEEEIKAILEQIASARHHGQSLRDSAQLLLEERQR